MRLIAAGLGARFASTIVGALSLPVALQVSGAAPAAPLVGTCDDGLQPGTFRTALAHATNGATIDLSQLQCSRITLSDTLGELVVSADNVKIVAASAGMTIDAGHRSRVLRNDGHGELHLEKLTLVAGQTAAGVGGCLYSNGSVFLSNSTITDCVAETDDANTIARGGGIFSKSGVTILSSTITGTTVRNRQGTAHGGAVDAAFVDMEPMPGLPPGAGSTIDSAHAEGIVATGGGIHDTLFARVYYSTISHCTALDAAAIDDGGGLGFFISNSTISGNVATGAGSVGGIGSRNAGLVYNATLAFNRGEQSGDLRTAATEPTFVTSSVFAYARNANGEAVPDISSSSLGGFANLVMERGTTVLPPDTISDPPNLTPLGDFGGRTQTHALLPGSPALGRGLNPLHFSTDQRGQPRSVRTATDIGAVQMTQPADPIFADDFE